MYLEIITPDDKVFESNVDAVQLPGKHGSFQVLDNHAPLISTLNEGTIKINLLDSHKKFKCLNEKIEPDKSNDKILRLNIKQGVVEVQDNKVIVLTD